MLKAVNQIQTFKYEEITTSEQDGVHIYKYDLIFDELSVFKNQTIAFVPAYVNHFTLSIKYFTTIIKIPTLPFVDCANNINKRLCFSELIKCANGVKILFVATIFHYKDEIEKLLFYEYDMKLATVNNFHYEPKNEREQFLHMRRVIDLMIWEIDWMHDSQCGKIDVDYYLAVNHD